MIARLQSLTLSRLVTAIALLAVFAMALRTPLDTDMLWHLRAGEWQVENGAILRADAFSHTRAGQPWINHSWLSQIALYGMYSLLGSAGLALFTATLAAVGMGFVYAQSDANAMLCAFVIVLASAAAAVFWSPRPQMMSFALSAVVLYLLWLHRRRGIDRLWLIPVIMIAWANLHGGFAIGFILLALAAAGEMARWLVEDVIGGRGQADAQARRAALVAGIRPVGRLALVGLASAAAVCINPYGPRMLLYPFQTVGIGVLRDFIQEWASPNFHGAETWPFIWLLLGTLALAGLSSLRLDWRDAVMVTGTAYAALLAGRNIATFAIVAAPVLMLHADDWLRGQGVRLNLARRPRGALLALNWALLALALAAVIAKGVIALDPAALAEERGRMFPAAAVEWLEAEQPPRPLFNSYNWGGYLIWEARDYPVFVDGRTDLYDDELLRGYLDTYFAQPGWEARLNAARVNTVLVETGSPLAQVLGLSRGWRRLYGDEQASLYVREVPLGE